MLRVLASTRTDIAVLSARHAETPISKGASGRDESGTGRTYERFPVESITRQVCERWKETLATHRFNGELPRVEAGAQTSRQPGPFTMIRCRSRTRTPALKRRPAKLRAGACGYKVTFIPGENMAKIDPYNGRASAPWDEFDIPPYTSPVEGCLRKSSRPPFEMVRSPRYSNARNMQG